MTTKTTPNTLGRYTQYANKVGFNHAKIMAYAKSELNPTRMWDYQRNTENPTPLLQRSEVQVYSDSDTLKLLLPRVQRIHLDKGQWQTSIHGDEHIETGVVTFITNGTVYIVPFIEYFGDCPHVTLFPYQHETLPVSEAFHHNGDTTEALVNEIDRITPTRDAQRIANEQYDEDHAAQEEFQLERNREDYANQKKLIRRFIKAIRSNSPPTTNPADDYMGDNAATYRELETTLYHRNEQATQLTIAREQGYHAAYGSLY